MNNSVVRNPMPTPDLPVFLPAIEASICVLVWPSVSPSRIEVSDNEFLSKEDRPGRNHMRGTWSLHLRGAVMLEVIERLEEWGFEADREKFLNGFRGAYFTRPRVEGSAE